MLWALLFYKYVWVLIGTDYAYHANTRWHRQEGGNSLQIQEVAPTTCVVALFSMWHFVMCGKWILEVAPTDSRGGPTTCVV